MFVNFNTSLLSVIMLNTVMPSVTILNFIVLSAFNARLDVASPWGLFINIILV